MLEPAIKHAEKIKEAYVGKLLDPAYRWEYIGPGRVWEEPSLNFDEFHHYASVLDGQVLGEIGYAVDHECRKGQQVYAAHFSLDNGLVFMRDLIQAFRDAFDKYGLNKLSFCVIIGNPAERQWDRLVSLFGGRVVGVKRDEALLEDHRLYDVKEYEVLAKHYRETLK